MTNPVCGNAENEDPLYPHYKDVWGNPLPHASIGEFGFDLNSKAVYPPANHYDFMSYCQPEWASPYTWTSLIYAINSAGMSAAGGSPPAPHLVISGWVEGGEVELPRPFWVEMQPAGLHDEPGVGPYSIEMQGAGGAILFARHLDPRDPYHNTSFDEGRIREVMPFSTDARQIGFCRLGEVLHTVPISQHAPQVEVLSPMGGAIWYGSGPFTIAWHAQDADGDALTAKVLFSADNGESWEAVAGNLKESQLEVNASGLPGSHSARVKVIVSDGVLTGEAVSEAISVNKKPPRVWIFSPADGTRFPFGEAVLGYGAATDPEDGPFQMSDCTGTPAWMVLLARGATSLSSRWAPAPIRSP